mgnify:CR=1 FL=1
MSVKKYFSKNIEYSTSLFGKQIMVLASNFFLYRTHLWGFDTNTFYFQNDCLALVEWVHCLNIFGNRFSIFRNQNHQLISNQFDAILFAFRNPCNLYATEIQNENGDTIQFVNAIPYFVHE